MMGTSDAAFSSSNCAGRSCISSPVAHSSHHCCLWTTRIGMKAGATKRSEILQVAPALALSWDGSESHQETVVEVIRTTIMDEKVVMFVTRIIPNPLELDSCTWPHWIWYSQLFTIKYFLLVLEYIRCWLSVSSVYWHIFGIGLELNSPSPRCGNASLSRKGWSRKSMSKLPLNPAA